MPPGQITMTTTEINQLLDSQMHPPWHDCADSVYYEEAHSQAVTADQEYLLEVDGLAYEDSSYPSHITNLWDHDNNKMVFEDVINSPLYKARVSLTFKPSVSTIGSLDIIIRPDNVSPDYEISRTIYFKALTTLISEPLDFYVKGQAKTDGMKVYIKPSVNGAIWNRGILVARTS